MHSTKVAGGQVSGESGLSILAMGVGPQVGPLSRVGQLLRVSQTNPSLFLTVTQAKFNNPKSNQQFETNPGSNFVVGETCHTTVDPYELTGLVIPNPLDKIFDTKTESA